MINYKYAREWQKSDVWKHFGRIVTSCLPAGGGEESFEARRAVEDLLFECVPQRQTCRCEWLPRNVISAFLSVRVNFPCQLDRAKGCPDSCSKKISDYVYGDVFWIDSCSDQYPEWQRSTLPCWGPRGTEKQVIDGFSVTSGWAIHLLLFQTSELLLLLASGSSDSGMLTSSPHPRLLGSRTWTESYN